MAPCKHCPRQGCGSYHDSCPDYRAYLEKKGNYNGHLEQARIDDTLHDLKKNITRPGHSPGLQHKNHTRRRRISNEKG